MSIGAGYCRWRIVEFMLVGKLFCEHNKFNRNFIFLIFLWKEIVLSRNVFWMIQDKKRELEYTDLLKDYIVHLKNDIQKKDKFIAILLKGKHSHYEETL